MDDVATAQTPLEALVQDVLAVTAGYTSAHGGTIPVIAAGGVFTGGDLARFLQLGASGVQMGTRFVCTDECDASVEYKEAYLHCRHEDILVMQSPLKLPLRVIRNRFVERLLSGEQMPFRCPYRCLATCEPDTSPYCIAQALVNAYRGNMSAGFATCGANAYRVDRIVSVRDLIQELAADCRLHLDPPATEVATPHAAEVERVRGMAHRLGVQPA
jgi:NAD(P)H-dependent flavin oxidoreductase YrpB (nitropropane dioxygenase family)